MDDDATDSELIVDAIADANSTASPDTNSPPEQLIEVADAIISRMNVKDRHDVDKMIHERALSCGAVVATLAIFWWLSFFQFGTSADQNAENSLVIGLTFLTISWLVPILVFLGSILNAISREQGKPAPGLIAGALFLMATYFVLEPIGFYLAGITNSEVGLVLWQTVRLAALAGGIYMGARLFIEAFTLSWVKRFLEMHKIDITPMENKSQIETEDSSNTPTEV